MTGRVFEQTRVLDVDEEADRVTVRTDRGDVVADQVVAATLLPPGTIGGFLAKTQPSRSYASAVRLRGQAPSAMLGGAHHKTGQKADTGAYYDKLEHGPTAPLRRAASSTAGLPRTATVDSLPYVGRSPRRQRTFVATGFKKWGMSNGTAAAMLLTDLIAGRDNPWAAVYDAARIGDVGTTAKLVKENVGVAKRFIHDRIARRRAPALADLGAEDLQAGEGRIVDVEGDKVGAYRAHDGTVHAVSVTCTHMSCALEWNSAETTWGLPLPRLPNQAAPSG
ncbi:MAG: FAD-dependent oxidoreductase [Pseudonocardiaceae bacterium]